MDVNAKIQGRVDNQEFIGHHDTYGPFGSKIHSIETLDDETYYSLREGPLSDIMSRSPESMEGSENEDEGELRSMVSSLSLPAEEELELEEIEIYEDDTPIIRAKKKELMKSL